MPIAAPPAPAAPAPARPDRLEPASAEELWQFVRAFVADKPGKRAMISQIAPLEYDGSRAVLGCAPAALAAVQGQSRALADLLQTVLGKTVQVTIRESDAVRPLPPLAAPPPQHNPVPGPGLSPAGPAHAAPPISRVPASIPPEIRDHPLVRKAIDVFGARIIDFKPVSGE